MLTTAARHWEFNRINMQKGQRSNADSQQSASAAARQTAPYATQCRVGTRGHMSTTYLNGQAVRQQPCELVSSCSSQAPLRGQAHAPALGPRVHQPQNPPRLGRPRTGKHGEQLLLQVAPREQARALALLVDLASPSGPAGTSRAAPRSPAPPAHRSLACTQCTGA